MDINIALNDQAKCDLQSLLETNETKSTIQRKKGTTFNHVINHALLNLFVQLSLLVWSFRDKFDLTYLYKLFCREHIRL